MKAIRVHAFGPPEVMRIEDIPEPAPGPRQLLISMKAAGVNPIDTYIRSGTYTRKKPTLPYTPGFDGSGIVEAAGSEVRRFKPGDRVYLNANITGSYAEKVVCEEENAFVLPNHLTFAQGAGIWVPYASAHHALFHVAKARPGETLLVHGATGGVGTAAVQTARAMGLKVIGTGGSERGRTMVRDQGAHIVLDHHASDFSSQAAAATEGRGPDIILEMLANVNLAKDLGMIAPRGRIVIIGNRGTVEINPRDAMGKDASIIGMLLLNTTSEEVARISAALAAGFSNRTLNPVVGKELLLDQAAQAHQEVLAPGSLRQNRAHPIAVQVFGHRGAPGFPRRGENTIGSFRLAVEKGADGIELDVRRCADGQIVVMHDPTIDRTTNGSGALSTLTYADLSRFKADNGEPIPLLETVLEMFGGRCAINIELKEAGLAHDVGDMVVRRGIAESIIVSAFDCDDDGKHIPTWHELGTISPGVSVALLATRAKLLRIGVEEYLRTAQNLGATGLHISRDAVEGDLIRTAHEARLAVRVYTVNIMPEVRYLRALGVDAIFTDFPEQAKQVLRNEIL